MTGWIKLHRQSFENKLYFSQRFTMFQAWIDLLLLANHKPAYINIKGRPIDLDAGQLAYSILSLADRWQWDRKSVSKYLDLLESEGQILQNRDNTTTIITICKWVTYQNEDGDVWTAEGQQKDNRRTTEGQQKDTEKDTDKNDNNDKNVKNDKNDKKVYTSTHFFNDLLSLGIDEQLANDVIEHRKKCKGILTQRAFNGLKGELDKFALGEKKTAADALTFLVEQTSWRTFTYEFYKNRNKSQQNQNNGKKNQYQNHVASTVDFGETKRAL